MSKLYSKIKLTKKLMESVLFPENIYCMSCGNLIDREHKYGLCNQCLDEISWINGFVCDRCGREVNYQGILCPDCIERKETYIANGRLCVNFNEKEKDIIHQFKYGNKPYLAKNIAEIMYDKLLAEEWIGEFPAESSIDSANRLLNIKKIDFLIPIPMNSRKEKIRGYNQSELIAQALGKLMNIDVICDIIINKNYEKSNASMGAYDRKMKVVNSFFSAENEKSILNKSKIKDKRLMLIDDVYTTGSTMQVCAKILKEMGAGEIYSCAFASAGLNVSITQKF